MPASLIMIFVSLFIATICSAQSRQIPAPQQSQTIVIYGATIHTLSNESPLNLMIFLAILSDLWNDYYYNSSAEIDSKYKAISKWLRK